MSSGFAWVAAMALVCAALALLLWQRGARSQGRASAERFVDSRIASGRAATPGGAAAPAGHTVPSASASAPASAPSTLRMAAAAPGSGVAAQRAASPAGRALGNVAARAGLDGARTPLVFALGATALLSAWTAFHAGALAACAVGVGCLATGCLVVTARSQRRRLAIARQLPTFLDGIVRLVTLGNSVPAAFQAALQTTEMPLRECLDRVSRMLRAGVEIDRALAHVAAIYRTREFEFVGAVLRLSVKYGGRADVMLERMSAFMRDLEQAERELSAMSAETRLSAWVLAVLPLIIGGFLVATNPTYFSGMWADVDGRRLVCLAFVLQVAGGYLLYRLTRLRS